MITIGIDPHKSSHTAVALDETGAMLGELRVLADSARLARLASVASLTSFVAASVDRFVAAATFSGFAAASSSTETMPALPRFPAVVESTFSHVASLGCRDVLLLSYNGNDRALHLSAAESRALADRVRLLSKALTGRCQLKLDVCWGERLDAAPRLFSKQDCGAGREHLVITSDRRVMPCSFHQLSIPVRDADEAMAVWRPGQDQMAIKRLDLPEYDCSDSFVVWSAAGA